MGVPIRLSILGSTGSIGQSTLELVRSSPPGTFEIIALTANRNAKKLAEQAREFDADFVAIGDEAFAGPLKEALAGTNTEVASGRQSLILAGQVEADFVMASIIGAAGLEPTLAAIDQGSSLGLANKESLVCAGDLVMARAEKSGATILPIDSEHNAIFQVLETHNPKGVSRLILTASGGPFLNHSISDLASVKASAALKHPIWDMGAKITIDSASMMNKGLELIEASYLFDRPSQEIDIVVHPQSIVHSMVEYVDGSVLAQMGSPDMKTPIAYALAWPSRMAAPVKKLDLTQMSGLTFFKPDAEKFPALRLAREALEAGGQATNILNAANEVAVAAFLENKIGFMQIPDIVEQSLSNMNIGNGSSSDLQHILAVDEEARLTATQLIKRLRN